MENTVSLLAASESMLPHLNAGLNATATLLLVVGWLLVKRGQVTAHRNAMISCFAVSVVFLISYLTYHYQHGDTKFPRDEYPTMAWVYYPLLASHVILAMSVPVLAIVTISLGLLDKRTQHRRWARITFPIWLYVSITGVLVYFILYWWCPPPAGG